MQIATFMDGGRSTLLQALVERHSMASSVTIAKEHRAKWREHLIRHLECDEDVTAESFEERATDTSKRPLSFYTEELWDIVSDVAEEDWVAPYVKDFEYMCTEDPVGMGIAYIIL